MDPLISRGRRVSSSRRHKITDSMPPTSRRIKGSDQVKSTEAPEATDEIPPIPLEPLLPSRRVTRSVTRALAATKQPITAESTVRDYRSSARLVNKEEQSTTAAPAQSCRKRAQHVTESNAIPKPRELRVSSSEKQKTDRRKQKTAPGLSSDNNKPLKTWEGVSKSTQTDPIVVEHHRREPEQAAVSRITQKPTTRAEQSTRILNWTATLQSPDDCPPAESVSSTTSALDIAYYKDRGYAVPAARSTMSTEAETPVVASRDEPSKTSKATRGKETTFADRLYNHNVELKPVRDDSLASIKERVMRDLSVHLRGKEQTKKAEKYWELDLLKCQDSNESVFQRTVMMDLFDRHETHEYLDYSCENLWFSEHLPRQEPGDALSQPKPDLAVSFRTTSLVPGNSLTKFSTFKELRGCICPEGTADELYHRAFPFFFVETKGRNGKNNNAEARYQNLNSACHALYYMYKIMHEANEDQKFFSEVRVFSVVATPEVFEVRLHRADRDIPPSPTDPPSASPPDAIRFLFDHLITLKDKYTRPQVTKIVYNILADYGITDLHRLLKDAMKTVFHLRRHRAAALINSHVPASPTPPPRPNRRNSSRGQVPATPPAWPNRRQSRSRTPTARSSSARKRQGDELTESFGSSQQKRRLGRLDLNDDDEDDESNGV